MFHHVDSLRKGGRFHLCWIADSWPSRFEEFTDRNQQLCSQDIREICDHLREVITSESEQPSHRFSLRLSSQLIRGLARLYQKKVDIFVDDVLHMTTNVNSRTSEQAAAVGGLVIEELPPEEVNVEQIQEEQAAAVGGLVIKELPPEEVNVEQIQEEQAAAVGGLVIKELPPEEVNVEQIQENAQNTVARIEDITLREPPLLEIRSIEDGFGELGRDPVDLMLVREISAMQQSALDLPLDFFTEISHDESGLDSPHDTAQMKWISEHDISVFTKSAVEVVEVPSLTDLEKGIPEIPEIPPPGLPAPEPQMQAVEQPSEEAQIEQPAREPAQQNEPQEIVLELQERRSQRNSNLNLSAEANYENIPGAENIPVQEYVPDCINDDSGSVADESSGDAANESSCDCIVDDASSGDGPAANARSDAGSEAGRGSGSDEGSCDGDACTLSL